MPRGNKKEARKEFAEEVAREYEAAREYEEKEYDEAREYEEKEWDEDLIPTESPLELMPLEMKNNIFKFLNLDELVNLGLTSKTNLIAVGSGARRLYLNLLKKERRYLIEGRYLTWSKNYLFNFRLLFQINECLKKQSEWFSGRFSELFSESFDPLKFIEFLINNEYYNLLQSFLTRIFMSPELLPGKILDEGTEELRELIFYENIFDQETHDESGLPLAYIFLEKSLFKFLKFLFVNGFDINYNDLDFSMINLNPAIGMETSHTETDVYSLLHAAILLDDVEKVKFLLDNGATINTYLDNDEGILITPLLLACEKNNYELVKLILDNGADPNEKGNIIWKEIYEDPDEHFPEKIYGIYHYRDYIDPLFFVILSSRAFDDYEDYYYDYDTQINILRLLLEKGANIKESSQGDIKLMSCTKNIDKEMLKILIEYGAMPERGRCNKKDTETLAFLSNDRHYNYNYNYDEDEEDE